MRKQAAHSPSLTMAARSISPPCREIEQIMLLGLESFSYQLALRSGNMDVFEFIRRVHELGLDGIQLNIVDTPPQRCGHLGSSDPGHWRAVRELIEELGLYIEIDTRQAELSDLDLAFDVCKALGANILRTYQMPANGAINAEKAIDILKQAAPRCRDEGVRIALENHEYQTAEEVLEIVRQVDSEWIGVFCDNGNGMLVWEDPDVTVETLAPYAITSHFKDHVVIEENGRPIVVGVTLGEGSMNLKKHFEILSRSPINSINIEVCYAYRAPFRRPQEQGAGGKLGEGAFAVVPGPFDVFFIPPPRFEVTPETLEWENHSVKQSVQYVKQLRKECEGK